VAGYDVQTIIGVAGSFLCGSLRTSAASALKQTVNAEKRRDNQRRKLIISIYCAFAELIGALGLSLPVFDFRMLTCGFLLKRKT
jgi:hypothetical protein